MKTTSSSGRTVFWPILAALSCLGSIQVVMAWSSRHTPELDMIREAHAQLRPLLARQKVYYQNNHLYATSLEELGLEPPGESAWPVTMSTARVDDRQLLLLEAGPSGRRACIDDRGRLHLSQLEPLPTIPLWEPPAGTRRRDAR